VFQVSVKDCIIFFYADHRVLGTSVAWLKSYLLHRSEGMIESEIENIMARDFLLNSRFSHIWPVFLNGPKIPYSSCLVKGKEYHEQI
jgi:hypothetical protein